MDAFLAVFVESIGLFVETAGQDLRYFLFICES